MMALLSDQVEDRQGTKFFGLVAAYTETMNMK